jgi:maltose-binding protein MalE
MLLAALLAIAVVAAVPAIAQVTQTNEQEADSGDATQNFTVTGGGDNSNACQGVQGITNTGNATNQTSVLQYANTDTEFEQDDSGNFTISPSSTTTCDSKVNQAASASGG